MKRIRILLVGVCCLLFCFVSSSDADLVHGIGELSLGAWDFSESMTDHAILDPEADLTFVVIVDPPPERSMVWGLNGATMVMVDSSFGELTTAPGDTSLYHWEWPSIMGATYVIRTVEHHFAKFRRLDPIIPVIEYVYQSDGSRVLDDGVPVESTTWGRIKSLYKEGWR